MTHEIVCFIIRISFECGTVEWNLGKIYSKSIQLFLRWVVCGLLSPRFVSNFESDFNSLCPNHSLECIIFFKFVCVRPFWNFMLLLLVFARSKLGPVHGQGRVLFHFDLQHKHYWIATKMASWKWWIQLPVCTGPDTGGGVIVVTASIVLFWSAHPLLRPLLQEEKKKKKACNSIYLREWIYWFFTFWLSHFSLVSIMFGHLLYSNAVNQSN